MVVDLRMVVDLKKRVDAVSASFEQLDACWLLTSQKFLLRKSKVSHEPVRGS